MPKFPDPFALSWGPWPPVAVEAAHARRTLAFRMREIELRRLVAAVLSQRAGELVKLATCIEDGCDRDLVQVLDDAERLGAAEIRPERVELQRLEQLQATIERGARVGPADYIEKCARAAVEVAIATGGTQKAAPIASENGCISPSRELEKAEAKSDDASELDSGSGSRSCGCNNPSGGCDPSAAGAGGGDQSGNNSTPGCTRGAAS